jgi:hypothetical protein
MLREVAPPAGAAPSREFEPRPHPSTDSKSALSGPFLPNSKDRAIARELGDLIAADSTERIEDRVDEMLTRAEAKTTTAFGHAPEDDGQGCMSVQVCTPSLPSPCRLPRRTRAPRVAAPHICGARGRR